MKIDSFRSALPYLIATLSLGLAGYFFFETRKQNAQLAELIAQSARADGKKQQDPYLAGPVKNRILKGYSEIHACYKSYLESKPTKDSGKLRIDWQISTSGRTIKPEVVLSDFGNPTLEKCVVEKISGWIFPEPPVQKYVEHTFRFESKK